KCGIRINLVRPEGSDKVTDHGDVRIEDLGALSAAVNGQLSRWPARSLGAAGNLHGRLLCLWLLRLRFRRRSRRSLRFRICCWLQLSLKRLQLHFERLNTFLVVGL